VSRKALGGWSGGKKSGEDDSMGREMWRRCVECVEKVGNWVAEPPFFSRLCTAFDVPGCQCDDWISASRDRPAFTG
jgi:hypothetical protein